MLYTHLAAALAAMAMGATGAWHVQGWRWRAADADRMEIEREARRGQAVRADTAAVRHETTRAALAETRQAVTQETDRAIAAAPDWHAGECFDPDGLRGIAAALGAAGDTGQPAPAVPAASAPQ
jgi:hypothetical protein